LLAGTAATLPLSAFAQRARARLAIISVDSSENEAHNLAAFRDAMRQLGYVEGHNIVIDFVSSGNITMLSDDAITLSNTAWELIRRKPDVILANSAISTVIANRLAPDLPIVCPSLSDSLVPSLVASFAHPGGRVTGLATDVELLMGKLAELLFDTIPDVTKIGYLSNSADGSMERYEQHVRTAAAARGAEVGIAYADKIDEITGALVQLAYDKVQAILVQ
jgi:putative ABC transport system substrate-binding protein